jgi:hypothetical protein
MFRGRAWQEAEARLGFAQSGRFATHRPHVVDSAFTHRPVVRLQRAGSN